KLGGGCVCVCVCVCVWFGLILQVCNRICKPRQCLSSAHVQSAEGIENYFCNPRYDGVCVCVCVRSVCDVFLVCVCVSTRYYNDLANKIVDLGRLHQLL